MSKTTPAAAANANLVIPSFAPILLDRRVLERNMKKGLLTREDYDKHLAALPDVSERSERIAASLIDDEEDDDLDEG